MALPQRLASVRVIRAAEGVHWHPSRTERALAEIDDRPEGLEREAVEHEDVPDDVIAGFLALLEQHRGRQVVNDSVLPAPAARLGAALERRYQRTPDPALAEALIALPVFVPPDDAVAVERYLKRRTGEVGPIGKEAWDRGLAVARRIGGEQRVAMRRTLHASGSGVTSPIPVLGAVADSQAGAAALAAAAPYDASLAWTVAAYGASGLATLVVIGVGAILLGEPVGPLVLVQGALLVIGFLPALEVMHRVAGTLARRAAKADKPPGSTDNVVAVWPFVPPIGIAVVAWLVVTGQ